MSRLFSTPTLEIDIDHLRAGSIWSSGSRRIDIHDPSASETTGLGLSDSSHGLDVGSSRQIQGIGSRRWRFPSPSIARIQEAGTQVMIRHSGLKRVG